MESFDSNNLIYKTITYPHENCQNELPVDECSIVLTALKLVKEVVCSAERYISADIPEIFYYKFPKKPETNESICNTEIENVGFSSDSYLGSISTAHSDVIGDDFNDTQRAVTIIQSPHSERVNQSEYAKHPDQIEWPTIGNFNLQNCAIKIRDYIDLWKLTPNTKHSVLMKDERKLLKNKGTRYFVDAMFSSPTPKCPNPLAVAKVHFYIQVPELMPKFYPVMITYRFEGFKSVYHAVGHKQLRSLEFQRFFIDTILHTKLKFYAELFQCRYSIDNCSLYSISEGGEEESPHKCSKRKLTADEDFSLSDVL